MTYRDYRLRMIELNQKIETNKRLKCPFNVKHYTRELEKLKKEYEEQNHTSEFRK